MRPKRRFAVSTKAAQLASLLTSCRAQTARSPSDAASVLLEDVPEDDPRALGDEAARLGLALPARRTRDERHLAVEPRHTTLRSSVDGEM
jgi:hypothetical protein